MVRTTRRVALAAALTTAIGLGAGTSAASAATTISGLPGKAPLVNKLYVSVTVVIACDPPPFFVSAYVTIRQVVGGKRIARGTAFVGGLTCDGQPRVYAVDVFPDPGFPGLSGSPPFKKGKAVISAEVNTGFDTAAAGPQQIKLTR